MRVITITTIVSTTGSAATIATAATRRFRRSSDTRENESPPRNALGKAIGQIALVQEKTSMAGEILRTVQSEPAVPKQKTRTESLRGLHCC